MTSIITPPPRYLGDIKLPRSSMSRSKPESSMTTTRQEPTPPHVKPDEELDRGRPRSRSQDKDSNSDGGGDDLGADGEINGDNWSNSDGGPARKRRRSRKGLDKKFECPHVGCGKSYSRAEHLHRHQLNHTPKQIYMCDYPGCERHFVRLDLCNRHRDRHTAKGSSLNRKDTLTSQTSPIQDMRPTFAAAGSVSPERSRTDGNYKLSGSSTTSLPFTSLTSLPAYTGVPASTNGLEYGPQDLSAAAYGQSIDRHRPQSAYQPPSSAQPTPIQTSVNAYGIMSPIPTQQGFGNPNGVTTPQSSVFVQSQNFPPFSLPPSNFAPPQTADVPRETSVPLAATTMGYVPESTAAEYSRSASQAGCEIMALDQLSMPSTVPMFGSETILQKSPYVGLPEDFMTYLFNASSQESSPMGTMVYPNYAEVQNSYNVPYYGPEASQLGYFPSAPQQVMSVTNLLDQNLPESVISEEKSLELFELIKERFQDSGQSPVERRKEAILEGDRNNDSHMLSRKMMQLYIVSYWLHFSDQLPILHKPTFSPDRTPNLLLLSMITIGAACLDKAHGQKTIKAGSELSNFLAAHLRWELFMDPNFRPPAKLWVFQTLLLLELYEKMYSTRELHERAHIHHATTITLMRRGRSLIGRTAAESPPTARSSDREHGSRQSSTSGVAHTADHWWNAWITNESTRRTAFAAFVIDSIHATMFGHSTVMVAHEMRLPLPCDEKLWTATSGAEVGRIEAQLASEDVKPVSFLEGLKRTLSGVEVKTNSFGRTILMAGLLSISWHMHQRDLQVNSLGVSQALGGRDKWRGTLTRAFDSWKSDYDKSFKRHDSGNGGVDPYSYESASSQDEINAVFESRVVLHHLAHMAMHVDVVDLQIYARAKRLLGRAIGTQDLNTAQRRMKDLWAPSAKARDATYYALQFLCSVLLRNEGNSPLTNGYNQSDNQWTYSARDDFLLNRPWVLYFAALVVWCYGYALEGPAVGSVLPTTREEQVQQMREYLHRWGSITSPEELKAKRGLNQNSALLLVLKEAFNFARWQLLHEGAALLGNCIKLNLGQTV